jgi:hypothetical protein
MSFYRLRIDEISGDAVVTSYTRWLESVQVKGTENQEVYVSCSPRFEHIWLESKKRLPEYLAKEPANIGLRSHYSIRLYTWTKIRIEREKARFVGRLTKGARAGVGKGCGRKRHPRASTSGLGELSPEVG